MGKEGLTPQTTEAAFRARLATDSLVNFSVQKEITETTSRLWACREKVAGEAVWVPAPVSGIFPDGKDAWAVKEAKEVEGQFPYIFTPNIDSFDKLLAVAAMGLGLNREGKRAALVTNFVMQQRSEREIIDESGNLHGIPGIEMALLEPVAALLAKAFPRGLIQTDGHGLGFEYLANQYGLPMLTLTSMPKLINAAFNHNMIQSRRSVSVSGDVGGVPLMNMVAEYTRGYGLDIKAVYGEKRAVQVFNDWAKEQIRGAQILFGDDIISSGKTLFKKVLHAAFEAGANNAVVFVPHADLVELTLENLNSCPLPTVLVTADTFPVRPEVAEAVAGNQRLWREPVFGSVMKAAEMDMQNLLADVITNPDTQAELLRQTELAIFPPYVDRFRTASDMLE